MITYRIVNRIGHPQRLGMSYLASMMPANERGQVASALAGITGTLPKLPELDAAVSDMTRFNALMGTDGPGFVKLWNEASALCAKAKSLYDRLLFQDPGEWYADADDIQAMAGWTSKVEQMYALYSAHFPKAAPSSAIPLGTPTCQTPISPGSASPAAPGEAAKDASGAPVVGVPGSAPPSTILGVSSTPLLIGGGAVVGLGLLIWALV